MAELLGASHFQAYSGVVTIGPFTEAHDAVASALAQLDSAWLRRQQSPELLRQALDNFHGASKALARLVEEREDEG